MKLALLWLVALGAGRAAAIDWRWSYRTLRSPHFDLIYNRDQRALARHYLLAAERAHELVYPIFGEGPARTLIILQDDTDESNGEANFLPYPHIRVYPVLPTATTGLGEYGDWALELLVHEYTHILNMHPAHGFYKPLSYIFGSLIRPNALLPTWYLEGLAVDLESALTNHGRLRAVQTAAAARALTLSDRLASETITTINEQAMLSWPFGNRPYLYGGWWWETALNEGAGAVAKLNRAYARRLPFLLNGPARDLTGRTPTEWWTLTKEKLRARAGDQIARLRAGGAPEPRPLIPAEGEQRAFAISPSGKHLVYAQFSPRAPGRVQVRTRQSTGQPFAAAPTRFLFRARDPSQVRWLDDDRFVIDQIDGDELYVTYRDLYLYDLRTGVKRRLTERERAQHPAASPSGSLIAYVRNEGGRHSLCVVNVASGRTQRYLSGDFTQRLASPEFSGDDEILFSLRTGDGHETFRRLNLGTRRVTKLAEEFSNVSALRRVAGGYLFTDAGTGVRNAYVLRDGAPTPEPVTNTLTHVDDADLDAQTNEIITNELTADGRRLFVTPLARQTPPKLDVAALPAAPPPPAVKFKIEDRPYQPWRYVLPRYWMPLVYQVENGLMFQGITTNADPLRRNTYSAFGSIDTVTKRPSYGIDYVNSSLPTRVGLRYAKTQSYLGASGSFLESQSGGVSFRQNWPFNSRRFGTLVGANWSDTASATRNYRRAGPVAGFNTSTLDSPLGTWHSAQFDFTHQEYLPQNGYIAYGRSSAHLSNTAQLGGGHRLFLDARAALSPRLPLANVITLGDRSVNGNYAINLVNSDLVVRGYPSGNFVGRKILNANLEYAFPAISLDLGTGTLPLFVRNVEVVLFTDFVAVDGGAYNLRRRLYELRTLGQPFASFGGELRLTSTAGYHLPLTATLGLYYGFDRDHGGGPSPFVTFGLGDLEGLKTASKTP